MKGIVLAGGSGSRLWPITLGVSKQLLPIFDKPLIYYPIATLMLAGIRDISIVTTPKDQESFINLLGDGSNFGVEFTYFIQHEPKGLAEAFIITQRHIGNNACALILGDNLFHGVGLGRHLSTFTEITGAQIFAHEVTDPERYGVVTFNNDGKVMSLEEKPTTPKSSYAVPGLYFYDSSVFDRAHSLEPSARGELEITSINETYRLEGSLKVEILPQGTVWMDTGTYASLQDASSYIRIVQERQGTAVACLEEISLRNEWISQVDIQKQIARYSSTPYGAYLMKLLTRSK